MLFFFFCIYFQHIFNIFFSIYFSQVLKRLFVTKKLDGSEDYLVSDKCFSIIGSKIKDFRDTLIKSDVPNNLQGVVKHYILPKGIKTNFEEG